MSVPEVAYQIQVLRDPVAGWTPAVVDPVSYRPGEYWYTDRSEAVADLAWLKEKLTWSDARIVRRDPDGTTTEEKP